MTAFSPLKTRSIGQPATVRTTSGVWKPVACLLVVAGAFALSNQAPRDLAAQSKSKLGPDYDSDGLADTMEDLLGTDVDSPDTDGDSFDDLEEVARHSDPLNPADIPVGSGLSVATYAYSEAGIFNFHTVVFIEDGGFGDLSYELGLVVNGVKIPVSQAAYSASAQGFFYSGVKEPQDRLFVLEMPIPEQMVTRMGDFAVYSIVRDQATVPRIPVIDVMSLDQMAGQTMEVMAAPISMGMGGGVVYRPLSGEGGSGATATGQICWKRISAVGTSGSSIVYEVESASCEDFDSACSPGACISSIGNVVTLPDPGGLLGG